MKLESRATCPLRRREENNPEVKAQVGFQKCRGKAGGQDALDARFLPSTGIGLSRKQQTLDEATEDRLVFGHARAPTWLFLRPEGRPST